MKEKQTKTDVKEAKWRVSVFLSSKGESQNLYETLERCGYEPRLDFVPDRNLERLQDNARSRKNG